MYRRYKTPSIWQEMNRMQQEMNKWFNVNYPQPKISTGAYPAMNIWADEESALITAEIPGVQKDNLEINVTGDTLTVSGERLLDDLPDGTRYHRQERKTGKFERSIQLPYTVDVNKVKATFKNGSLEVFLPRVEAEKPKKITVKS
jgi:HSP20 family protein